MPNYEGYNDLNWGTTISDFIVLYPNAKENRENLELFSEYYSRSFRELICNNGLHHKEYVFFKEKLWKVFVAYGDENFISSGEMANKLLNKLINEYTKDVLFKNSKKDKNKYTVDDMIYNEYNLYYFISKKLTIHILGLEELDQNMNKVADRLLCEYYYPDINDEIEKKRMNDSIKDFEL